MRVFFPLKLNSISLLLFNERAYFETHFEERLPSLLVLLSIKVSKFSKVRHIVNSYQILKSCIKSVVYIFLDNHMKIFCSKYLFHFKLKLVDE